MGLIEPRHSFELQRPVVLVIDDSPAHRLLMTSLLEQEGYRAVAAQDGEAGVRAVEEHRPDLLLLDLLMPGIDGYEVCRRLRADDRLDQMPIILMTARTDVEDVVRGLDAGADDFLTKPFRTPELLARMRSSMRQRQTMKRMATAHTVAAVLANAVEAKDPATEHHCQRLANLAARVGRRVGLDEREIEAVAYGALLHDVGKIGVPEEILTKAGPLEEDERIVLRRHPEIGERICQPLINGGILPIIRHHHERWDGSGYPDGLKAIEIPLGARVVAVVDAFDAMTHDRPYRRARPVEAALEEMWRFAGSQFDPELVPLLDEEIRGYQTVSVVQPVAELLPAALLH